MATFGIVRRLGALLVAGAATLGLAACGTGETAGTDSSSQGSNSVITVATQRGPHLFAPYEWQKYVAKGYTVKVVPMSNSNDERDALMSGDVDFAVMGVPTVISQASQGGGIRVIAGAADGGSGLMAKKGISSVAALKGKKIGYVPGSSQEMALRLTLEKAGLNPNKDVQMTNIGYSEMADALSRGDIDAFAGGEMATSLAKVAGMSEPVSIYDTAIGKVNLALAASDTVISKNPKLVKVVIDAHKKATDALRTNTTMWKQDAEKQFSIDGKALSKAVDNIWLHWDLSDSYVGQCNEVAKQMVKIGSIKTAPEQSAYLTAEFVK